MAFPQVYGDGAVEQGVEFQPVFVEDLRECLAVEIIQVQDAKLAFHVAHMGHDRVRLGLMDRELVVFQPELIGRLDERLHGKGVMLGGDGEPGFAGRPVDETLLQHAVLRDDLPGIPEEFLSILRDGDPAV